MDARIKELLKPELLNTINGLELIARVIVEGFMSGGNKSQAVGTGQEFSQYRNYQPGDDLRQLDWKMYARSEKYFIKQSEIETNITVKFFIDASNSMAYEEDGFTKIQYAKVMTAALAYLARKQGDTFGLYGINNKKISLVEPRSEQQQFMRFLYTLVNVKTESTWKKDDVTHLLSHHAKELIFFVTDLYDQENDILEFVSKLKTVRNEVVVFHVMGAKEISLNYNGSFEFKDLEQDTIVKVDTTTQRQAYVEKIEQWIKTLRNHLHEKNIGYNLMLTATPIDEALRTFLKSRKMLGA